MNQKLSRATFAVMAILRMMYNIHNRTGWIEPKIEDINLTARQILDININISRATKTRVMNELINAGLIERPIYTKEYRLTKKTIKWMQEELGITTKI